MIFIPVNIDAPIVVDSKINVQKSLTTNFPDVVFQLHRDTCKYLDLGDSVTLKATVTNTYMKTVPFTGELSVKNPHRGEIEVKFNEIDFTETGNNTVTVLVETESFSASFQFLVFVQDISDDIRKILGVE